MWGVDGTGAGGVLADEEVLEGLWKVRLTAELTRRRRRGGKSSGKRGAS